MGFFSNEYLPWVEAEIKKDYPMLDYETIERIIEETKICDILPRYSLKRYIEVNKNDG